MEILFRLIEWLVRTLLNENDRRQSPPVVAEPSAQVGTLRAQVEQRATTLAGQARGTTLAQPRAQPLMNNARSAGQGPIYDDGILRPVLTVLALIALVILIAAWGVYVLGG